MTEQQAIALADTEFWKDLSLRERAIFQLYEERLCMPFAVFHEAMEKTLGRPIFSHEFAYTDELKRELIGERLPPTMEEIIRLIPEEKRILVFHS